MYKKGVQPISPVDSMRQAYAEHLLGEFAMFIVGHEIAHITRGHVDYVKSKRGKSFISELEWHGIDKDTALERQALEFDADRRTVASRAESMYMTGSAETIGKQPWSQSGRPLSIESLQFDWAFAANVMYRLFGDDIFTKQQLEERTHPPMPLRR
jgi:hypothetical protein